MNSLVFIFVMFCFQESQKNSGSAQKLDCYVYKKFQTRQCEFCDYSCEETGKLKWHINAVHTRLKPHFSKMGDFSTAQQPKLKRQVDTVHKGLKQLCSLSVLKKRVDAGNKKLKPPYSCELCNYSTAYPPILKKHVAAAHKGLKPHDC